MQPKNITTAQLTAILFAIKGHKFLTITTETELKMNKGKGNMVNPYHGHIIKRSTANVSMNFDYSNAINSRREKEGNEETFVAKPRAWGEKVPGTCFVQHNGAMYMEVHYKSAPSNIEYIDVRTNTTISKDVLSPWLQEKKSNAENQGLEKEFILRDVKIQNIKECKVNGEHYTIR